MAMALRLENESDFVRIEKSIPYVFTVNYSAGQSLVYAAHNNESGGATVTQSNANWLISSDNHTLFSNDKILLEGA